jgi:hypothetical protein
MISIEEEVQRIVHFLSQGIDYTLTIGTLSVTPICSDEACWVVNWQEQFDNTILECQKDFISLFDAAQCFVEKRRYMCIGSDFDTLENDNE